MSVVPCTMNSIRQTQALNQRELDNAIPPSASWHADYRDTAYIYVGGLPFDISEGDLVTIFSQFGNPTHVNLIRDKDTGKSKGFAFLKYADQRSCDLAVDNLGGAEVLGRRLRVDHTRYKKKDDEDEETYRVDKDFQAARSNGSGASGSEDTEDDGKRQKKQRTRPILKEEKEFNELLQFKEGEEEDPMRFYLIEEKKEQVGRAIAEAEKNEKKHRHRHRHRHPRHHEDEWSHKHVVERQAKNHRSDRYRSSEREDENQPQRHQRSWDSNQPRSRSRERDKRQRRYRNS